MSLLSIITGLLFCQSCILWSFNLSFRSSIPNLRNLLVFFNAYLSSCIFDFFKKIFLWGHKKTTTILKIDMPLHYSHGERMGINVFTLSDFHPLNKNVKAVSEAIGVLCTSSRPVTFTQLWALFLSTSHDNLMLSWGS
jgi:hypothetical protein